jgi:hypothetical protein
LNFCCFVHLETVIGEEPEEKKKLSKHHQASTTCLLLKCDSFLKFELSLGYSVLWNLFLHMPIYWHLMLLNTHDIKGPLVTLGISICLNVVSIETLDLDAKKGSVLTIEISWSRSRNLNLVSMSLAKTVLFGQDRDLSRLVKIFVIISDFCGFLDFFSISTEK